MIIAKAPFKKIGDGESGTIYRPFIEVDVFSYKRDQWVPVAMLVDTGADYTMLPRRYAEILNIDFNTDCVSIITSGIGGVETVYMYKSLLIKIDKWKQKVPVGFLERDDIPPLLGRLRCLERIEVTLKNFETILKI